MSNLFDQLESVISMPHGWCSLEKAKCLSAFVLATRPNLVVELGCWSGRSLISMALACKEVGYGKVIGIDPYEAAASVEGQTGENAKWWSRQQAHDEMYAYCLSKIHEFGVQTITQLQRIRSDDYKPDGPINLLHHDANHGPQALKDIQRLSPFVPVGGWVAMDDLTWQDGGTAGGAQHLLSTGFIEHFRVHKPGIDFAVFQRVRMPKNKIT